MHPTDADLYGIADMITATLGTVESKKIVETKNFYVQVEGHLHGPTHASDYYVYVATPVQASVTINHQYTLSYYLPRNGSTPLSAHRVALYTTMLALVDAHRSIAPNIENATG